MGEISELTEHIEHAAHGAEHAEDEGRKKLSRAIGITMALLGVLVAVCAALVSGARTELLATLVGQTQISQKAQTASNKHRMLSAQLQQLHASLPVNRDEFAKIDANIKSQTAGIKGADERKVAELVALHTGQILETVTPSKDDLLRFVKLIRRVNNQKVAAYEYADSFNDSITAFTKSVEHYEWGQLCAEVAIIFCSVALLLSMRRFWLAGVALGCAGIVLIAMSYLTLEHDLHLAEEKIHHAKEHYKEFNTDGEDRETDEKLMLDIENYAGVTPSPTPAPAPAHH